MLTELEGPLLIINFKEVFDMSFHKDWEREDNGKIRRDETGRMNSRYVETDYNTPNRPTKPVSTNAPDIRNRARLFYNGHAIRPPLFPDNNCSSDEEGYDSNSELDPFFG
jgi:hypothetical protein